MNPYQAEKQDLIKRLNLLYPYGLRWFESKSLHVLKALYNKKVVKK